MLMTQETPRHNLKLLWWMRVIAIAGQSATVAFCFGVLHVPLPLAPLFVIIAALVVVNIVTHFRLKLASPISQTEFFFQLVIDMLGLAGLLYFTGGASNPFTSLFILQVVIAAVALSPRYCWFAACFAVLLYTLLLFFHIDLPMLAHSHGGDFFSLHVLGMWVNFLLLALLVAWFAARMAGVLRRQDMLMAEAEQLASLGLLATQAAHDLGTPLATIAILAGEYRQEATDTQGKERAVIVLAQIERCKESISRIAATAGVMRAESGRPMPLDTYLSHIAERFRLSRDGLEFTFTMNGQRPAPVIAAGIGLEQAIVNLLANAADASPKVRLEARWDRQVLTLAIADAGAGMPDAVRRSLGEPGFTTKPAGLGMGLYLTRTAIARLGGALAAHTPEEGGTLLEITLPLARLSL